MAKQRTDNFEAPANKTQLSDAELEKVTGGTGSQSTGAGAGKASFEPFTISKRIDKSSPGLF